MSLYRFPIDQPDWIAAEQRLRDQVWQDDEDWKRYRVFLDQTSWCIMGIFLGLFIACIALQSDTGVLIAIGLYCSTALIFQPVMIDRKRRQLDQRAMAVCRKMPESIRSDAWDAYRLGSIRRKMIEEEQPVVRELKSSIGWPIRP